jgi:hypothetical protein
MWFHSYCSTALTLQFVVMPLVAERVPSAGGGRCRICGALVAEIARDLAAPSSVAKAEKTSGAASADESHPARE